jgi:hypothetical protein
MATTKEKFRNLIDGLYSKTSDGLLEWHAAHDPSIGYAAELGTASVVIYAGQNEDGEPIIGIRLLLNKKIVDSFDDESLRGIDPGVHGFDHYYPYMAELYEMARRKATNADAAIDSILKELDSLW